MRPGRDVACNIYSCNVCSLSKAIPEPVEGSKDFKSCKKLPVPELVEGVEGEECNLGFNRVGDILVARGRA
ncbi:MAG: hypothetical protein M1292_02485 [Bacteroidetes bacterium]|nr:hypothetical protein [Bacteroidota bacterium]